MTRPSGYWDQLLDPAARRYAQGVRVLTTLLIGCLIVLTVLATWALVVLLWRTLYG